MVVAQRKIQVVVIDDSAFMRKSLTLMLESDPEIHVVGAGRDGADGIEKIRKLKPDLVTLDIEMPGMDGLTALKTIMKEMPLPVLMVSSLTTEGAHATLDAFNLGAVDFISKDLSYVSLDIVHIKDELISKVKEIAYSRALQIRFRHLRSLVRPLTTPAAPESFSPLRAKPVAGKPEAVIIGISTGGPPALLQTIPKLSQNFPLPIAVVQHMPPHFTKTMAERLNSMSPLRIKEAEHGEIFEQGKVLIAPGGRHLTFAVESGKTVTVISDEPRESIFRPCADITMKSASETIAAPLIGVIMTGMGKDGLEGLKIIHQNGGYIIAQDEETCVVYGMPKVAVEEGIVDKIVSLSAIPETLSRVADGRIV